jgi:hypothetical protein
MCLQNGDYETYFRNIEVLYSCLNNRNIPETAHGIGATNVVLAIYGTYNAVSEINVKYQNASTYIFGKTSLNGFSKIVTKLLDSEKYDKLKEAKKIYELSYNNEKRKEGQKEYEQKSIIMKEEENIKGIMTKKGIKQKREKNITKKETKMREEKNAKGSMTRKETKMRVEKYIRGSMTRKEIKMKVEKNIKGSMTRKEIKMKVEKNIRGSMTKKEIKMKVEKNKKWKWTENEE